VSVVEEVVVGVGYVQSLGADGVEGRGAGAGKAAATDGLDVHRRRTQHLHNMKTHREERVGVSGEDWRQQTEGGVIRPCGRGSPRYEDTVRHCLMGV
jgi:hypothetical protein